MSAQPVTGATRAAAGFALACLVAAAAYGAWIVRVDSQRMPTSEVVAAANSAIATEMTDGDAIRPIPEWFADARLGFDDWPILMGNELDDWQLHRFERVTVVYPTTHETAARAEVEQMGLTDLVAAYDADGYRAVRGTLPPVSQVVWDAADTVADSVVTQTIDGAEQTRCERWLHDSWHCERFNAFLFVGARLREMGNQEPRRCVVMNATEPPASWNLRWDAVPAASRELRVRAGNTYEAVRSERGAPLRFRVRVDGEVLLDRTFSIDDQSFEELRVPLPATRVAAVEFELGTTDHFDRFFCVQAQVVDP